MGFAWNPWSCLARKSVFLTSLAFAIICQLKGWEPCVDVFLSLRPGIQCVVRVLPGVLLLRNGGRMESYILAFLKSSAMHRNKQEIRNRQYILQEMTCVSVEKLCCINRAQTPWRNKDPKEITRNNSPQRLIHAEGLGNIIFCNVSFSYVRNWIMSKYRIIK